MNNVLLSMIETEFDYLLQMLPLTEILSGPEKYQSIERIKYLLGAA